MNSDAKIVDESHSFGGKVYLHVKYFMNLCSHIASVYVSIDSCSVVLMHASKI